MWFYLTKVIVTDTSSDLKYWESDGIGLQLLIELFPLGLFNLI